MTIEENNQREARAGETELAMIGKVAVATAEYGIKIFEAMGHDARYLTAGAHISVMDHVVLKDEIACRECKDVLEVERSYADTGCERNLVYIGMTFPKHPFCRSQR